jgi:hypothetical protein
MAINPLSTIPSASTTGFTPAPNLGVTAGGDTSGSFGQAGVLPNVTTTGQSVTAAPSFYTDYLNNLATQGQQAGSNAQYVGAQPLQQQAFNQVGQNVGNYQPALSSAINLASSVGNTSLADAVGNMGEANIRRNLAPATTAGLVGSGQFGSSRGATALGDTIANAELGLTAQQQQALQQDNMNKINAANSLGNLATTTQNLGLGDVNALSTLGGQQQTIGQNEQLFPMQQLTNESQLLRGFNIPTSSATSATGPATQGQLGLSPLQQLMSLGTLGAAGFTADKSGATPFGNLANFIKTNGGNDLSGYLSKLFGNNTTSTTPSTTDTTVNAQPVVLPSGDILTPRGDGTYTNNAGEIVNSDGNPS